MFPISIPKEVELFVGVVGLAAIAIFFIYNIITNIRSNKRNKHREPPILNPQGMKQVKICAFEPKSGKIIYATLINGCPMDINAYLYGKTFVVGEYNIRSYQYVIIKDLGKVVRVNSVYVPGTVVIDIAGYYKGVFDYKVGLPVIKLEACELWYMDKETAEIYGFI